MTGSSARDWATPRGSLDDPREGSSGDGLQRPRLDDPRGSLEDPQPRYCRDLSAATKLLRVGGHGRSTHGIRSFKDKENEFDLSSGGQSWPPLAKYLSSGLGLPGSS